MLEAIGVADRLEGKTCPIRAIRVSDGLQPGGILFDAEDPEDPLGKMVENRLLRAALRDPERAGFHVREDVAPLKIRRRLPPRRLNTQFPRS